METHPLFEKQAPEFQIAKPSSNDWEAQPEYLQLIVRDGKMDVFDDYSTMLGVGQILDFCFEHNEVDRLVEMYTTLLSPAKLSITDNAELIIPPLLAFLLLKPSMSIHFARLCPWSALPPATSQLLVPHVPTILKALTNHSHRVGDLVLEPFKSVLAETTHLTLDSFRDVVENVAFAVQSPGLALELFFQSLEPVSASLLRQSPMVTQYCINHIFGAALDHIEEANEPSSPGVELWHLKIVTFKIHRAKLKSERRVDAPLLQRLAAGDHVRFKMAKPPSNAPLLPITSFDALIEMSRPGEVTFRCIQHPPVYIEQCAWIMKHCGSAVTTKTMINTTMQLISEKEACCEVFEQLVGGKSQQESLALPSVEYHSKDLNERQNLFVKTCANIQRGLVCLHGPPGCGKTFTIVRLLQLLLEQGPDERVLVTAPTHNATDNILRKYVECYERERIPSRGPIRVSTDVSCSHSASKHERTGTIHVKARRSPLRITIVKVLFFNQSILSI